MKYVDQIKKICLLQVLPSSLNLKVRICVIAVLLVIAVPLLKTSDVIFKHSDYEAGVSCVLKGIGSEYSFSCSKMDFIGLPIKDVNPELKTWAYTNRDYGSVIVEREGFSDGLKFTIKSGILKKELSYKLKV